MVRVQGEENVVEIEPDREAPVRPSSFEELFLDVHDRLYRALYFITGSSTDAEELMQDAFLAWPLDSSFPRLAPEIRSTT